MLADVCQGLLHNPVDHRLDGQGKDPSMLTNSIFQLMLA